MDHRKISSRGGTSTAKRYGKDHYSELGKKGAEARLAKYGTEYYKELSRKGVEARRRKAEEKKSLTEKIVDFIVKN